MSTPSVPAETAWTEQDERELQRFATFDPEPHQRYDWDYAAIFAREILRLRDENALVAKTYLELTSLYARLREAHDAKCGEAESLRAENERMKHSSSRRWNVQEDDETGALLVCKGHHERSAGCDFEEYVPRSQLAATREGETPEIPDKVTFEVWSGDECLAAGLDTQEEAAPTMTFFAHRYAPPVLVRSTTRRTRVDNG